MSKGKRKLVIKINNHISRGNFLKPNITELYGKTITVIANIRGYIWLDDNPFLAKYLTDPTVFSGVILGPNEYEIILEKPLGGSDA